MPILSILESDIFISRLSADITIWCVYFSLAPNQNENYDLYLFLIPLTSFSFTWFLSIIHDRFRKGKINLESTLELLNKFDIPFDYIHVKCIFKVRNYYLIILEVILTCFYF